MKITNFEARVLKVTNRSYFMGLADGGHIRIPREHIDKNPRVPVPMSLLDEDGQLECGLIVSMVKIAFPNGFERYALDEKVYGKQVEEVTQTSIEPLVTDLLEDLKKQESATLEFKSSVWHPANPEDSYDHTYQMKEIIKQCTAGANSEKHYIRIYIGVSRGQNGYFASGIQDDLPNWGQNFGTDELEAQFFNMTKQLTSGAFLASLSVDFINLNKQIVMRIDVKHNGDIVLYGANRELYIRCGSSMHKIDNNADFIQTVRNYKTK